MAGSLAATSFTPSASCCSATTRAGTAGRWNTRRSAWRRPRGRSSSWPIRAAAGMPSVPTSGCRCAPAPTQPCCSAGCGSSSMRSSTTRTSCATGRSVSTSWSSASEEYPGGARGGDHRPHGGADPRLGPHVCDGRTRLHPLVADHRPAGVQHLGDSRCRACCARSRAMSISRGGDVFVGPECGRPLRLRDRDGAPAVRGTEGQAAGCGPAPGLYLPRHEGLRGRHRARLGPALHQPRQRLLHGQPDGGVQGDGGQQPLPGPGVLHDGQQRTDGLRQRRARVPGDDEAGPAGLLRTQHDAERADLGLHTAGRRLAGAALHAGRHQRAGDGAAGRGAAMSPISGICSPGAWGSAMPSPGRTRRTSSTTGWSRAGPPGRMSSSPGVRPTCIAARAPDPGGRSSISRPAFATPSGKVEFLFRGAGKSRLRPAALLPRGGGALRALPVGDVHRLARGRVFPLRPPPYPGTAPARGGPDVHDRPVGDGAARLRGRRLGPARNLDRRHGRPRLWPLLHAGGPGAGAAWLVEAGIAAGAGEHVRMWAFNDGQGDARRRGGADRPRTGHPAHEGNAVLAGRADGGRGGGARGGIRPDQRVAARPGKARCCNPPPSPTISCSTMSPATAWSSRRWRSPSTAAPRRCNERLRPLRRPPAGRRGRRFHLRRKCCRGRRMSLRGMRICLTRRSGPGSRTAC